MTILTANSTKQSSNELNQSKNMSKNNSKTMTPDHNNLQNYLLQNAVNTTIANMTEDDKEKKIIAEFAHLLEKSKQLFNGLR